MEILIYIGEGLVAGLINFDKVGRIGTKTGSNGLEDVSGTLQFDDAINIQFTSGTTGSPKGATLTHHNILNNGFFVGEALQLGEMQARREAAYGLGFFSGERQKARAAAQAIIDNPASAWKAEAGISLLRLELAASGEKLELLSNASTLRQPRVQAWSIQEIAKLGGKDAAAVSNPQ